MSERTNALYGLAALTLLAAVGLLTYLYLGGTFKPSYRVDAIFARAGQNLRSGSDVKLRGVLVGSVARTEVTPDGQARVVMRMSPRHRIPDNVTAAIRAKTLFGEKFVELRIPPEGPSRRFLGEGDVIPASRTIPPFEVETVLQKAVPLLNAVDPEMLGAALQALAQALVGNEAPLRRATLQGEAVLTRTEPTLPNLERNLVHLRNFAAALDDSDTDLLRALDGLQRAGGAIVEHRADLETVLAKLPPLVADLADILSATEPDLATLSSQGADLLRRVGDRSRVDLVRTVSALANFLEVWVDDLRDGPYWRILLDLGLPINTGTPYPPGGRPSPESTASAGRDVRTLLGLRPGSAAGAVAGVLGDALPPGAVGDLARRLAGGAR